MFGKEKGGNREAYGKEVGTFAGAFCVFASDGLCEWGTPGAGVVASCGVLDFDDFCSAFFLVLFFIKRQEGRCAKQRKLRKGISDQQQ